MKKRNSFIDRDPGVVESLTEMFQRLYIAAPLAILFFFSAWCFITAGISAGLH